MEKQKSLSTPPKTACHVKHAKEKRNNYGVHVKKENWKQWSEKEMRKFQRSYNCVRA